MLSRTLRVLAISACSLAGCLALAGHVSAGEPSTGCCRVASVEAGIAGQQATGQHRVELVEPWSAWRRLVGKTRLAEFPLTPDLAVDLEVERFYITHGATRFVLGRALTPLPFDPSSVVLLRGSVAGSPSSRVFLALSEHGSLGMIDHRGVRFRVDSRGQRQLTVTSAPAAGGTLDVPLCGTEDAAFLGKASSAAPSPQLRVGGPPAIRGLRQIELAIETDYEFLQLFDDLDAAMAYVVAAFAAVSEIYVRDTGARVDLSFVRLWDDPDDLFNEPDPLSSFQSYWEANMGLVTRDVAQFFSGRRNLPYGGVAFLGGMCGSQGYSVAGYILGFFDNPTSPSVVNRDITVAAHELGHSSGSPHTHSLGIDSCDNEFSTPQRGSLMSYCGQTFTGGASNTDLRFHTETQTIMEDLFAGSACLAFDCNQNGSDDAVDISLGSSVDVNMNGIPDECEDCNTNGVLDDADISGGTSSDANANGIPDECEPDCNANGTPDDIDVAQGTSADANGNGIPDECQADCNTNGVPDYDEIQADMSRDRNRNARLDACEDCDDDGTPDLEALEQANNLWLASLDHSRAREYLAKVGPLTRISEDAGIAEGQDLRITSDRRILVSSRLDHRVVELALDGSVVGDLVPSGAGGLSEPAGLLLPGDGRLLVASRGTDSVLAYSLTSGAFLGTLVAPGTGGLMAPFGLELTAGPGPRTLLVTSGDNRVLQFDSETGAFLGELVTVAGNGGLQNPHGLLLLPSGNLLVASYGSDQVLEYQATTGAFVRQFNQGGTATRLTLDQPWGLRLGPDGGVYVSRAHDHGDHRPDPLSPERLHLTNARIYHFDAATGFLLRAYVLGVNSGVEHPTGFDFVPGEATDCNLNLIPDSCDIADGTEQDVDGDGIPDSCNVVSGLVFQDSFESGDTSAWSNSL